MNQKIKNYVDLLFDDVPRSQKAIELKNEILSNLNDKFQALRAEGKTENEAYGLAVAGLGNIDELIQALMPDEAMSAKIDSYKKRKSLLTAIGVGCLIFAPAILILFGIIDNEELGTVMRLVMVAIGTGLLIYANMNTPTDVSQYLKSENTTTHKKWVNSVSNFYWMLIVLIYFATSIFTRAWDITWMIFIAGAAGWHGIKSLIDYQNEK
ncbi:MAG: permease prefix domain 1-containing protein [Treponemataceae bacterium]